MRPASSLFTKILAWFFLNIVLVATVLGLFFVFQSKMDLLAVLGQQGANRLRTAGMLIAHDLTRLPPSDWPAILARHAAIHQVDFTLVLENGKYSSSAKNTLPRLVADRVAEAVQNERPKSRHPPAHKGGGPPPPARDPKPLLMMQTKNPARYWAGVRIPLPPAPSGPPPSAFLFAVSDSLTGNGFFFDPVPWLAATAAVIFISVLFWIPMVRSITRPLVRMTRATEKIAKGRFEVSIQEGRMDEIGSLAKSINRMAARLAAFVTGQKRFLGDVAHELGSPVARIQFGLGALEQRIEKQNRRRVRDVLEDVEELSKLVNELLAFSRADLKSDTVRLETIDLLQVVQTAVKREKTPAAKIDIAVDPKIRVVASEDLLIRAFANLVRNAVKYAGDAGMITISAEKKNSHVEIEVRDAGPGVPDGLLDQLFEPFFRPETSRDRDSGGVGLGLAIVKTCVETCQGTISAANLNPEGFAVTIMLAAC